MVAPIAQRPERTMGVAVLYNESQFLVKGEPRDILAEQGVVACGRAIAEALAAAGYKVALVPIHGDVEDALAGHPPTEWVLFNLGEGVNGRLFEEVRIAHAIEAMGYLFTGSSGEALARSTHKAQAKACLAQAGVPTPPWRLYRHPAEVVEEGLPFPLMVKPVAEDASQGIGAGAVVHDLAGLEARVGYIVKTYRQAALAEQFIAGREFNVALWEAPPTNGPTLLGPLFRASPPEVLPLSEIDFSAFADPYERIVSFAAKWEEDSFAYQHTPVLNPAPVEEDLAEQIRDAALRSWAAIGCRGYARADMRVDAAGTPYVVEVNCNPDLSPDAGFYRAARSAGYTYQDMVLRILETAMQYSYPKLEVSVLELA